MVNRNAARHLFLVVSILLCFFIYMGYRLFGGSDATTAPQDEPATELASAPGMPAPPSLRPRGTGVPGLRPSSSAAPADDWIPSETGVVIPAPPGGTAPFDASSSSLPGAITGLIPAPPMDVAPAGMRPPAGGALPPEMLPSAGVTASPDENPDDMDAESSLPPFLPPGSGPKPLGSEAAPSPSALPIPPFGGADAPVAAGDAPASPVAEEYSAAGGDAAPLFPASEPDDYLYQDAAEEISPPPMAMRPPGPASGVAPPPAAAPESRPAAPAPMARETAPPSPVRRYDGGYDEYGGYAGYGDEEDETPSGSESLRMYVVRTGDTLSNIAARELGSISLADNIFLLNRDVIDDPDHLMAGVKIRLPVRDGQPTAEPGESAMGARRPTSGTGRVHAVVRGDTLSSIAEAYYGSSAAWRFLYEANKNIVPNPNQLSVGTELSIPPYEEGF